MGSTVQLDVADHVRSLESTAVVDKGVAASIAERAGHATRLAFGAVLPEHAPAARVKAYFWATVRRLVTRDAASEDARARFLLSALVADLRDSGRTREAIWDEIERGWAQRFPTHVLAEFRDRQCA